VTSIIVAAASGRRFSALRERRYSE